MDARITKAEAELMMPIPANHAARDAVEATRLAAIRLRDAALAARVRGLFVALAEAVRRRRAMAELNALGDRELADIGLTRAEIPYVFDRRRREQPAVTVAAPQRRPVVVATRPAPANDAALAGPAAA